MKRSPASQAATWITGLPFGYMLRSITSASY
ncbi:hypothetical protein ABH899_005446 [Paenibacillus sp. RC84]